MIQMVTQWSLPVYWVRLGDDPRAPGLVVVGTFLQTRLLARQGMDPMKWEHLKAAPLLEQPVRIMYSAEPEEPGLVADLHAVVPTSLFPREPWEAEPPEDEMTPLFLGRVVRVAADFVARGRMPQEAMHHFQTILNGRTAEPVDRMLGDLSRKA